MGKIIAYLGPPTTVSQALERGSTSPPSPEAMSTGFGLGWYPAVTEVHGSSVPQVQPVRIFSSLPPMADPKALEVARAYQSHCLIAASNGIDRHVGNATSHQPLRTDTLLLAVDARIEGFRDVLLRPLTQTLSEHAFALLSGPSPQEVCLALLSDAIVGKGPDPDALASAMEQFVTQLQAIASDHNLPASLAVVLSDGRSIIAVRTATHGAPPPLYTLLADEHSPIPTSARMVATEPLHPGDWQPLEPHSLTIFVMEPGEQDSPPPYGMHNEGHSSW